MFHTRIKQGAGRREQGVRCREQGVGFLVSWGLFFARYSGFYGPQSYSGIVIIGGFEVVQRCGEQGRLRVVLGVGGIALHLRVRCRSRFRG